MSVLEVAHELGWSKRDARERLQWLQDRHGGLLFRESEAPNAKLWVDPLRLGQVWPSRFDELGHVRAAEERIRVAAEMADRVIEDLLDAKRELLRGGVPRRAPPTPAQK